MEPQKTLNSQNSLEKEEQSWRYHIPHLILYYKTMVIKTVCIGVKTDTLMEYNIGPRNQPIHV